MVHPGCFFMERAGWAQQRGRGLNKEKEEGGWIEIEKNVILFGITADRRNSSWVELIGIIWTISHLSLFQCVYLYISTMSLMTTHQQQMQLFEWSSSSNQKEKKIAQIEFQSYWISNGAKKYVSAMCDVSTFHSCHFHFVPKSIILNSMFWFDHYQASPFLLQFVSGFCAMRHLRAKLCNKFGKLCHKWHVITAINQNDRRLCYKNRNRSSLTTYKWALIDSCHKIFEHICVFIEPDMHWEGASRRYHGHHHLITTFH